MKRDLFQEMKARFRVVPVGSMIPGGGFVLPLGEIVQAYGNHEAMCQCIGTSLQRFIRAGAVRYHYGRNCFGLDLPPVLTIAQVDTLRCILRQSMPDIVITARYRRRGKPKVKTIIGETPMHTFNDTMRLLRSPVESM